MLRHLILTAFILTISVTAPVIAENPIVDFEQTDNQMNAAIAAAKSSLNVFESEYSYTATTADNFLLKIEVPTGPDGASEHIWTAVTGRQDNGDYTGILANQPVDFDMNAGDPVSFPASMVSDWSYMKGGKLHGNYTTRVMLPHLPDDQAAGLRAMLAPLPE
ncbi:YegJ family protein [Pseudaestuariivita rosea]|uniref:YegJ family protein n=1 Tax=Pseudaestuariivita rosea TaxID=2763263 RepID=UPI001ABA2908|nr:DUF2314 domain-containing protein [Pseudaestuariivita rosea]